MKRGFFLLTFVIVVLSSCKKNYNCVCEGWSVHEQLFTDHKTVTAKSEKKADIGCMSKISDYEGQYAEAGEDGLVVVICNLE